MCNDLTSRVVLALILSSTVKVAALTVGEVLDICKSRSDLVSCNYINWEEEDSCSRDDSAPHCQNSFRRDRRELQSAPIFEQSTTTTTRAFSGSGVRDARLQWDIFFAPDPNPSSPSLQYCMFDTDSPTFLNTQAIIQAFFRYLVAEKGPPYFETSDKARREVNPSLLYVKKLDAPEDNYRLVDEVVSTMLVSSGCIWLATEEREYFYLNNIMADMTVRHPHMMISSVAMDRSVLERSPRVFSLAPDERRELDTSLQVVSRTGYMDAVAYIYDDTPHDALKCSRIDDMASSFEYDVVSAIAVNFSNPGDLVNVTRDLMLLFPDILVFCAERMDVITLFVNTLEAEIFQPSAVIISSSLVSRAEYWTLLDGRGQYVINTDLWSASLNTTSDLIFEHLTNRELAANVLQNVSGDFSGPSPTLASVKSASVMLWTCLELSIWALENAKMNPAPLFSIPLNALVEVIVTLMVQGNARSSFIGSIHFDEFGERVADTLALQWQQQLPGNLNPQLLGAEDVPQVVAPSQFASQWLWFPKPLYSDMPCYRTDSQQGPLGFRDVDEWGEYTDCGECEPGSLGVNKYGKVYGLEAFGEMLIRACEKCPAGQAAVTTSVQGIATTNVECYNCSAGRFTREAGLSSCQECAKGRYQTESGVSYCDPCEIGRFNEKLGQTTCFACGYPSVSVVPGSVDCTSCPRGADCPNETETGFSTYLSKPGYYILNLGNGLDSETWEKNRLSYPLGVVYECPDKEGICLRGNVCSDEKAMHGPLCGTCKPGYQKGGPYHACKKCPPVFVSILAYLFEDVMMIITCLVIYFECIVSNTYQDHQIMILLKQLMTYLWLMYRFSEWMIIEVGGDVHPRDWLQNLRFTTFSYQCLLENMKLNDEVVYSQIIASYWWLPICFLDILIVFALQIPIQKLFPHLRVVPVKMSMGALAMIIPFVLHLRFTSDALEVFRCFKVDVNRLMMNTSIRCDSDKHREWQIVAGVGLVVVSFGLPVVFFFVMRARRQKLWDPYQVQLLGFLTMGYKHEYWYWETVLMVRKVAFVSFPMLPMFESAKNDLYASNNARRVVLLIFSIGFYSLDQLCKPWDFRTFYILPRFEEAQLQAFIITFALQVLQQSFFGKSVDDFQYDMTCRCVAFLTLLIHMRFWVIAARGLFGGWFAKFIRRLSGKADLVLFKRRRIIISADGIDATSLNTRSRKNLVQIFGRIARIHLDNTDMFDIKDYVKSVKKVCTMAAYFQRLEVEHGRHAGQVYEEHKARLAEEQRRRDEQTTKSSVLGSMSVSTSKAVTASKSGTALKSRASEDAKPMSSTVSFATTGSEEQPVRTTPTYDSSKPSVAPDASLEDIIEAQSEASLYEHNVLSVAAVFKSYLRERNSIADEVKRSRQLIIAQKRSQAQRQDSKEDEDEDFVDEADGKGNQMNVAADVVTGILRSSLKDKALSAGGGFELPDYRVLASHMRELQSELDTLLEENMELVQAAHKTNVPIPVCNNCGHFRIDDTLLACRKCGNLYTTFLPEGDPELDPDPKDLDAVEGTFKQVLPDSGEGRQAPASAPEELKSPAPPPAEGLTELAPSLAGGSSASSAESTQLTLAPKEDPTEQPADNVQEEEEKDPYAIRRLETFDVERFSFDADKAQALRDEIAMLQAQIEEESAKLESEKSTLSEGSMARDPVPRVASRDGSDKSSMLRDGSDFSSMPHERSDESVRTNNPNRSVPPVPLDRYLRSSVASERDAVPEGRNAFPVQSRQPMPKQSAKGSSKPKKLKDEVSKETANKLEAVNKEINDLAAEIERYDKKAEKMTEYIEGMHRQLEIHKAGRAAASMKHRSGLSGVGASSLWAKLGR